MAPHAAIIGAGVIGCSIGLELRRRGFDVSVIDRNGEAGHGTTSASCGVVRRYYSQPGMIAMAHEAASIWADWAGYLGPVEEDLAVFHRPGVLFILPRVDETVHALLAEMRRVGIKASLLTPEQVRQRFPYLDTASHFPARPVSDPYSSSRAGVRSPAPSSKRIRATSSLQASPPAICGGPGSAKACVSF